MKFEELNVRKETIRALNDMGIVEPMPIQEKAIPLVRAGKDVIGKSKTGSGKTLAFGVPILENIMPRQGLQALIMAPTRELACQISTEMKKFGKYLNCSIATVYGGVAIEPQMREIARSEIVVGTPGRLLDHIGRRTLNLSGIKCAVLDEADKMVDMGFIDDIRKILRYTPRTKQMLLFGATISREIERLKREQMNNPETVQAELFVEDDFLEQYYYDIKPHQKFSLLVHLLKNDGVGQAIIFCSARRTVDIVARNLRKQGVKGDLIHGNLTQGKRQRALDNFNNRRTKVLVASAVASRGLDIKDVSHVFNYDLSQDSQEYIHRVGRTARAGEKGKAITLLSNRDHDAFRAILGRYDIKVKKLEPGHFPSLYFDAGMAQRPRGYGRFNNYPRRRDTNNLPQRRETNSHSWPNRWG